MISLGYFIAVALIIFLLGFYTCLTRTNAIGILMGIEMILNSVGINFIAFSHFNSNHIDGHIMTIFVIVLAAAEAVVALALLLAIYRRFGGIETGSATTLKG